MSSVPCMDSLSFTFLSYVSWELATMLLGRLKASWRDVQVMNGGETRNRWATAALAAFLMMYLDIIIDPVALRGDRWFLGKIYYYPDGGSYFGITLANFLGWYFVCFVIVRLFVSLERVIFAKAPKSEQETLGRQEPRIFIPLQGARACRSIFRRARIQSFHDLPDRRARAGRGGRDYCFAADRD